MPEHGDCEGQRKSAEDGWHLKSECSAGMADDNRQRQSRFGIFIKEMKLAVCVSV